MTENKHDAYQWETEEQVIAAQQLFHSNVFKTFLYEPLNTE
jgi:hypothetical protein